MKTVLLSAVLMLCLLKGFSQAGSIDTVFSRKTIANFVAATTGNSEQAKCVAIQADGKIVTGATIGTMGFVMRMNAGGSMDLTFGKNGIATCYGFALTSLALQGDGKIVVAGFGSNGSNNDFVLVRLNTNGSMDNSFDGDGRVMTAIGTAADLANAVAIQANGKIVAAGYSYNGTNNDFSLVRYNTDGSLDVTFDGDGMLMTPIGSAADQANAVAIQSDGKIVAAGYSNNTTNDFALVRYNTNGSLDVTFDGDGMLLTAVSTSHDVANSVAIQSDGKIVAAGYSYVSGYTDFGLVRYNADGSLDATFDGDGKVTTAIGASGDVILSMAIQTDGKIVVAGYYSNGSFVDMVLARYNTNGSLDTGFDGDGKVMIGPGMYDDQITAIALQSDGKIVAVGYSQFPSNYDYTVLRYNTNGSLDTGFDGDGQLTSGIGGSNDQAYAIAVQGNGKIVVAGYAYSGTTNDFALARYNTDGSLDVTFDGDGMLMTPIGSAADQAYAVAIQGDGKIVVAGYSNNGTNNTFALARYNTDGSLDVTFDGDGKLTTAMGSSASQITALAIQSDGKIVAAGYSSNGTNNDFALARYNTDGSLDVTFDGDGKLMTPIGGAADQATSVAIQSDGRIVAAGYSNNGTNNDFALARYNTDGSLDVTFDGDGKLITPIGTSADIAYAVAIQGDGKIVAAGYSNSGVNNDFALARYNTDGSLDVTFDGDGKLMTPIGVAADVANGVAIQSDGKIVAAGYSNSGVNNDFALARYNTDGSLDVTFDGDGKAVFDILGGSSETASAVQISSGRIYLAGIVTTEALQDFSLVAVSTGAMTLPLVMLEFSGKLVNENASLNWKTENEKNVLESVVERSTDGRTYTAVGVVAAANTPGVHYYRFTDPGVAGLDARVVYYRLKQKDIDGKITYSRIIALNLAGKKSIVLLYPNPVPGAALLTINASQNEDITYRIIDQGGKIWSSGKTVLQQGSNTVPMDVSGLQAGMYIIDVRGTHTQEQIRFSKL